MRRHLALMVLILAVIAGLILFRATRHHRGQGSKPVARAQDTVPPSNPSCEEVAPSPASVESTVSESPVEVQGQPTAPRAIPPKLHHIIVQAMEGAVVVLVKTKKMWETYETSELRADQESRAEFDMTDGEWILLYSYNSGAGSWTIRRLDSTERSVRLSYLTSTPVEVVCVRKDGDPIEGADVTVEFEVEMISRFDLAGNYIGSTWVKLPIRQAVTGRQGRCGIECLPTSGWIGIGRGRIPGCRFLFTATFAGLKAEQKIDGFPKKEVRLVLE